MRVGGLLPVPSGRAPNSEVADARALPAGPRLSRCLLPVPAECSQHFSLQIYKICSFLVLPPPKQQPLLLPPSDVRDGEGIEGPGSGSL